MGPLEGVRLIEIAGIGPGPFAGMLLGDMGAEVIRVERPGGAFIGGNGAPQDLLSRNKRCICVDLKSADGVATVLDLVKSAAGLFEGNRPGVAERLGIGPDACMAVNTALVYGRMTGWGRDGPMARAAGHDINYISLTGALHAMGRAGEKPAIPLNLVGDFGGGGLLLAFGMVCALLEAKTSGRGQVVDAAMIDGASALMASLFGAHQTGWWSDERGTNMLDGGAHFYEVYQTSDGRYVSVGAIEPQFYAALLEGLGLAGEALPGQMDASSWPRMKTRFEEIFATKTRDEWVAHFEGKDACVAPVLSLSEAPEHPHNAARGTFVEAFGALHPHPAPRFSRTPAKVETAPSKPGEHTDAILGELGYAREKIEALRAAGAVS
jgi:alpha-methylacyl-CoA racemase